MNTAQAIILVLLIGLANCNIAFAQEKEIISYEKKNIIKVNLISPILSSFSMGYERVITPNQSFQVSFFLQDQRFNFSSQDELKGFGIVPEYRFYLSERKEAPGGIFIAPFLSYRNYKANYESYSFDPNTGMSSNTPRTAKYENIGLGFTVGAQWIFKKKVSIDVWGGTGYSIGKSDETSNDPNRSFYFGDFPYQEGGGFLGRIGGTIGLAF
jgi:hypothetical protein